MPRSRARREPSCQSAVLPIPASPSNNNADPPAGNASKNAANATSSRRLPTICSAMPLTSRPGTPIVPSVT